MLRPMLSKKFQKKLVYIDRVRDLARFFVPELVSLPETVYKYASLVLALACGSITFLSHFDCVGQTPTGGTWTSTEETLVPRPKARRKAKAKTFKTYKFIKFGWIFLSTRQPKLKLLYAVFDSLTARAHAHTPVTLSSPLFLRLSKPISATPHISIQQHVHTLAFRGLLSALNPHTLNERIVIPPQYLPQSLTHTNDCVTAVLPTTRQVYGSNCPPCRPNPSPHTSNTASAQ